jgi:predicted membrane metal-binding protein
MKSNSHESFQGYAREKTGSNRSFGFVIGGVFVLIALWPLVHGEPPRYWALAPAVPLIVLAAFRPDMLQRPNELWAKFGLLLGRIVSPIVMGVIFYLWITPFALVMRLFKKRLLALEFERDAASYWIVRPAADPDAARLRRPY